MEHIEIKDFPDDFTKWIGTTVAETESGQKVKTRWNQELEMLDIVYRYLGEPLDIEWSIQLCEFRNAGVHQFVGWKVTVKILNIKSVAQATYAFVLDDDNRIVDMIKYAGEIAPDNKVNVQ
jgi:hypothetical protein